MTWLNDGESVDPAFKPLEEAGQGESEGFELAERDLIAHATHGDDGTTTHILLDVDPRDEEEAPPQDVYGEADEEIRPDA
jgi:hypothetical protein